MEAGIFSASQFKTSVVAHNLEFLENKIAFCFVFSSFVGFLIHDPVHLGEVEN